MPDKITSEFPTMGEAAIHGMVNVSATGAEPHVYRGVRQTEVQRTSGMNRAPVPDVPEVQSAAYEGIIAPNVAGKVGPTRFEEGLGADPRYPTSFVQGIVNGYMTAPNQPQHNASYAVMSSKTADGRGAFGRTSPPPTWDEVRGSELAAFAQGSGYSRALDAEQAVRQPPLRVGADLSRLQFDEKGRQVYERASAVNDDRFRPNAASGYRAGEPR